MKNIIKVIAVLISTLLLATACSGNGDQQNKSNTKSYKLDSGKSIKVPKKPKRIVILTQTFVGNAIQLDNKPIAVPKDIDNSSVLKNKTKDINKIDSSNIEKITSLKPDLIITSSDDKNVKKLNKIAPTVPYEYQKRDYMEQHIELGKLLGKEKPAKKWVENWKKQTSKDEKEIKNHLGKNVNVTVLENINKNIFIYGKNWGHGTEIIYQSFNLNMPENIQNETKKDGWLKISPEKLDSYTADYNFELTKKGEQPSIKNTNLWKNIEKDNIYSLDSSIFYNNDPYSLEKQRKLIKHKLLN